MVNKIKDLMDLDPLKLAEELTGESYKTSELTTGIGFALNLKKTQAMNALMDATNDTKFSETTEDYLKKVEEVGFEVVYKEDFLDENNQEHLFILWNKELSALLCFDTFRGKRNGGKVYYNWSPNNMNDFYKSTSSGQMVSCYFKSDFSEQMPFDEPKPIWKEQTYENLILQQDEWYKKDAAFIKENNLKAVWAGDHDCREAIKNNLSLLQRDGTFLKKWIKQPFLWLLHHGDTKAADYNYEEINKKRLNALPKYVQDCICV